MEGRCSLFLLDNENKELVANVFDKAGDLSEIRIPMTMGVVGRVATTRTMMNFIRSHNNSLIIDEFVICTLRGYLGECRLRLLFKLTAGGGDRRRFAVTSNCHRRPRSVDSHALWDSGTFVGVAELCNKTGRTGFTRHDEQKARTFAVYCATSISHCLLYRKVQEAQRRSHMAAELLVQGSQLLISEEDVRKLTNETIKDWRYWSPNFARFSFSPRSIGDGDAYMSASMTMFNDLGFTARYSMNKKKLASFLLRVARGYREVPYHNWSHAFSVAHFCWISLRTPAVLHGLDELERLALLIACLCHDIDHRGTTNAFQLQSKTPLAQLYSSEGSVLERHHYAQTVQILQMNECNILDQLTRTQYQTVLSHIRDVILATDIAVHLKKVGRIKAMVDQGYDPMSRDHHYLFMCLLMTSSDLSDQSKDFRNSKAIAENIYREFFSQGDLEKQMGASPMEMMDRDRAAVPKIQLDFMDTVALPVFEMVAELVPEGRSTFEAITLNRQCWAALDEILVERGNRPVLGLDYLRDDELEKQVLERVHKKKNQQNKVNCLR
ncbi:3'5'-cyclic nucleotide phosphodiesterase [Ancylostoma ceylanicum]|uniref:Phosphodiesterase n=1 Tax=Ancylostoma ceylanicum TaxID=53326 RepID=A0A0D6LWM8_9BILA|nr:3'5'-cyclic nucleotide phosphodiesterase [Ancylostoma ceylanicum]